MPDLAVFSASYAQARGKFVDAARGAGATVYEYRHPSLKGPLGEPLCLDVAVAGPENAERAVNLAGVTHKALADYQGVLIDAFAAMLPRAEVTCIVVEFGTLPRKEVQRANMAGRWLRYHGAHQPALARKVHADFCEAFYPSDPAWRAAVLEQSKEILDRGIAGIGR